MDLQSRPLQYFVAVARTRSFSRAAAELHVSQPALSAQIRELERVLGFRLFERSSRHVALTREGRLFLDEAHRQVDQSARLLRAAEEIRTTELRIGAAVYTSLIPERVALTAGFGRAHPDVRLRIENFIQRQQYRLLRLGELDLALAIGLVTKGTEIFGDAVSEIVFPPDFERMTLAKRPVRLLVPAESPLARADPVPMAALSGARIAMLGIYHGVELIDAISRPLAEAGAELIVPPEGNAIAVEQYGSAEGIPAVALGWFEYGQDRANRVPVGIEGLEVETELALLRQHALEHRPAVERFWAFANEAAGGLRSGTGR